MTTPHLPAIPEPPYPEDFSYVVGYEMGPHAYFVTTDKSRLSCTLCGDTIADHYQLPEWGCDYKKLQDWIATRVRRHQRVKHAEKVHVYTETGWVPLGWLAKHTTEKGEST
jgi:hypothetical protein